MARATRTEAPGADVAKETLVWLRVLCERLPETGEKASWGHPNFTVGGKIFAAVEEYQGEWAICFKTVREHQQALVEDSERFYVAPYVGRHGWVSMRLADGVNLGELKALVLNSYRLVAPKRVLAAKAAAAAPGEARPKATAPSSARRGPASRRPSASRRRPRPSRPRPR